MSGKNTAVFGIYPNEAELSDAVEQLKLVGFRVTDLSLMIPENLGSKDMGHEKHSKAPEGALTGGVVGAVVGALVAALTKAGMIQIPITAAGGLITADTVVVILAGIGAVGVLGGVIGVLLGLCRPEYEAKRYQGRIRSGGILLSVHCDSPGWRIRAKSVLRRTGADGIASTPEAGADFGGSEKPFPRAQLRILLAHRNFLTTPQGNHVTKQAPLVEPPAIVHGTEQRSPV